MAAFVEGVAGWAVGATDQNEVGQPQPMTYSWAKQAKQWHDDVDNDRHKMLELLLGRHADRSNLAAPLETLDLLGSSGFSHCDTGQSAYDQSVDEDMAIPVEFRDLDLDAPLPSGWEKCLDLQTGKIYYLLRDNGSSRLPATLSKGSLSSISPVLKHPSSPLHDITVCTNANSDVRLNVSKPPFMPLSSARMGKCAFLNKDGARVGSTNGFAVDLNSSPLQEIALCDAALPNASSDQEIHATTLEMMTVGCANCLMFVMLSRMNPRCPNCGSTAILDFVQPAAKRVKRF